MGQKEGLPIGADEFAGLQLRVVLLILRNVLRFGPGGQMSVGQCCPGPAGGLTRRLTLQSWRSERRKAAPLGWQLRHHLEVASFIIFFTQIMNQY